MVSERWTTPWGSGGDLAGATGLGTTVRVGMGPGRTVPVTFPSWGVGFSVVVWSSFGATVHPAAPTVRMTIRVSRTLRAGVATCIASAPHTAATTSYLCPVHG